MNGFKDLEAWVLSGEICNEIRIFMEPTSPNKDFGLKNQTNNPSGSIMDNIAEGHERKGNLEFIQFLGIAKASCGELRSRPYRFLDSALISQEQFDGILPKTILLGKKIGTFGSYLKKSERKGSKSD
ncbi:MAG: four helix bundle protein [Bacteroidota bacterium]